MSGSSTTYASGITYQLDGQMASATFANGLTETYGYSTDGRLQLNSIQTAKPSATPLLALGFSYTGTAGNNGNLQSQTITALENVTGHGAMQVKHSQSYSYDGVNRLGSVSETETTPPTGDAAQPWSMTFGFDAYGNQWTTTTPLSLADSASPTQRTQFNQSKNQLQISGDTYYAAGQLKTDSNLGTMAYYAGGQQYSVTNGSNGAKYYYDPEGRRTQKVLSGTTAGATTFVYDAAGQLTAEYSNIANTDTGIQYLTSDHLGSTRLITDSSGNCLNQWDYFPFGGQISNALLDGNREYQCSVTTGETLKFTGKERGDAQTEGALDYFGARYFSSDHGRWTSADEPFADQRAGDPQSWNLFTYGRNNPLSYLDPSGNCSVKPGDSSATDDPGEPCVAAGGTSVTVSGTYDPDEARLVMFMYLTRRALNVQIKQAVGIGVSVYAGEALGAGIGLAADALAASRLARYLASARQAARIAAQTSTGAARARRVIAAYDVRTGAIAIGRSRSLPAASELEPEMVSHLFDAGGLGARNPGVTAPVGCCAEVDAANQLLQGGSRWEDIRFTDAIEPRTGNIIPRCGNCTAVFGRQ